jgi:hypothetical protein
LNSPSDKPSAKLIADMLRTNGPVDARYQFKDNEDDEYYSMRGGEDYVMSDFGAEANHGTVEPFIIGPI